MAEEKLRIVLSADGVTGTTSGLRRVEGAIDATKTAAGRLGGALGLSAAGAAAGFVAMTKTSLASATALVDGADKIGFSIKGFQELGYAAKQAGVDQGAFDAAMSKLSVNLSRAADASSTMGQLFTSLGVTVRDAEGNLRPAESVLRDIADRFREMKNPADAARAAMEIFGKSGIPVVNVLRDGADGLNAQAAAARRLGIVLDEQLLRATKNLGDEMATVEDQLGAARDLIVSSMIPALSKLAGATIKAAAGWNELLSGFSQTKRLNAEASLASVRTEIQDLHRELASLGKDVTGPTFSGDPLGAGGQARVLRIRNRLLDLQAQERDLAASLATPQAPPKAPGGSPLEDLLEKPEKLKKAKREVDEFAKEMLQLRESTTRSVFATAGLVLDEFASARTEADRALSEELAKIEAAEAKAVELAKGSAEKIAAAREEANRAELAALAKHEAEKTSVAKREADNRARLEKDRAAAVRSLQLDALPPAAREQAAQILAAQEEFRERQKLFANDPDLLAKSFEVLQLKINLANASAQGLKGTVQEFANSLVGDFTSGVTGLFAAWLQGSAAASESFKAFAASFLEQAARMILAQTVMVALQAALGAAFGGAGVVAGSAVQLPASLGFPRAADGGIVTRPTLALIGEGGQPEAIVPLSKAQQMGFGGGGDLHVTTVVNLGGPGGPTQQQNQAGISGAELGRIITSKVVETIRNEQRPGGILSGTGRG